MGDASAQGATLAWELGDAWEESAEYPGALWRETPIDTAPGYAPALRLRQLQATGGLRQSWWLGPTLTSARLATTGAVWKVQERLTPPPDQDGQQWIAQIEAAGPVHPSSYSDCYHQLAPVIGQLPWTFNGLFWNWSGGPWEDARPGHYRGAWWRYDLRSAYRWAGSMGLPDPASYEVVEGRACRDLPGLFWVELLGPHRHLPETFQGRGPVVMSHEELEAYRPRYRALRGLTWTREMPRGMVDRVLDRLPCHKESGRTYWGRWVAREPLRVWTAKSGWVTPKRNPLLHFVWGWLIVGRVRARIWQDAERAAHIYVDEVVVPRELPTGPRAGDWRLKERYSGLVVERVGAFGPAGGPRAMVTGVPRCNRAPMGPLSA